MDQDFTQQLDAMMKARQEPKTDYLALAQQLVPVLIQQFDEYADVVGEVVDKIAPELAEYIDRYRNFVDDQDVKSFKLLTSGGMTSSEAVSFMIARKEASAKALQNFQKVQK